MRCSTNTILGTSGPANHVPLWLFARDASSKVVLTTLRSWVTGLKSEEVQHFLSDNSVPVGELVEASPPFTIYFVIPPNKLD